MKLNKKLLVSFLVILIIGSFSWTIIKIIQSASKPRDFNVIIVGIDTCRMDHLSCYGYELDTTPNLSSYANDCILFTNTMSQSPWTLPAFASLFTSCYPSVHGARGKMHKKTFYRIRPNIPTGTEVLSEHGFLTMALTNCPFVGPAFAFSRGFGNFDYVRGDNFKIRRADQTIDRAISWIEKNKEKKFFVFIHLFDPHLSYDPPKEHLKRIIHLSGFDYKGQLKAPFSPLDNLRTGKLSLSDEDMKFIELLYDAEISLVDESCGRLFHYLKDRKIYDKTIIVVTSDHGEEFWEHNGFEHGHTQYDELLRIPHLIKMPSSVHGGRKISALVSLVDIMPTLFEILSIKAPKNFQGKSLLKLIKKEGRIEKERKAFAEETLYGKELIAIKKDSYKLITTPLFDDVKLFNMREDPQEKKDLSEIEREKVLAMKQQLVGWMRTNLEAVKKLKPESFVDLDKKTLEVLKSLGYVK